MMSYATTLNDRLRCAGKFARDLAEQRLHVRLERAPHLEVKCIRRGTPQHDLRLGEYCARAHLNGKFALIQIERTCACENGCGMRAKNFYGDLPMGYIDERMSVGCKSPLQI